MAPPSTGLLAWQHAKNITLADGAAVSQWDDSSGNAHHATQATGANQPTFRADAASTGYPAVQFDGTADFLSYATAGYLAGTNNVASALLCAVIRPTSFPASGSQGNWHGISNGTVATNTRIRGGINSGATSVNWRVGGRRLDADSQQFADSAVGVAPLVDDGFMVTVEADWANSDARMWAGRTMVAENLAFQTAGNTSATNSLAAALGARGDGTLEWFAGYIFDAYTYVPTLSAADRGLLWDWVESQWLFLAGQGVPAEQPLFWPGDGPFSPQQWIPDGWWDTTAPAAAVAAEGPHTFPSQYGGYF